MGLIREIVLELESSGEFWAKGLSDRPKEEIYYHADLLIQAGLAEGIRFGFTPLPQAELSGLTSQGHEFADLVRNESIWGQVMQKVESVGSVPFEVLVRMLRRSNL